MNEDRIDYERLCEEYEHKIKELYRQIDEFNMQNEELQKTIKETDCHITHMAKEIARLEGRIEGLEFSIRCNGVSGGEVKG